MSAFRRVPATRVATAVMVGVVLTVAGCESSNPKANPSGSPSQSGSTSTSTPTGTASPSVAPSASPSATSTPQPTASEGAHPISVYFFSTLSKERLAALPRATDSVAVLSESVRALVVGLTDVERSTGFSTQLPAGTRVQQVELEHGIATIELIGMNASGGTLSDAALAQIVFTATQFPTVTGVRIEVGNRHLAPHAGITPADRPMTRNDFESWSPQVLVESPLFGQTIRSPARIHGTANTFEAVFFVEITDWDGRIVAVQRVMATSGSGTRGTFDVTVPYSTGRAGSGELITFVYSAKDGSRIVISETPLRVEP